MMDPKALAAPPPPGPAEVKVVGDVRVSVVMTPKEIYDKLTAAGVGKINLRLDKQIMAGIMAGLYIGFGFTTCMVIGGWVPNMAAQYPGLQSFLFCAFGFPLGLTLIIMCGSDLFTGNCNYMVLAFIEGRCTFLHICKVLVVSYFSNLCGCIFIAQLLVWADVYPADKKEFPINLAYKKCHYSWGVACAKGIVANWLVNLAVWLAISAQDFNSKYLGVFLPISSFIAMGLEHCIANMFLVPLAMMLGRQPYVTSRPALRAKVVTVNHYIRYSMVPTTIGNFIGGAGFVGVLHAFVLSDLFDTVYAKTYAGYQRCMSVIRKDGRAKAGQV